MAMEGAGGQRRIENPSCLYYKLNDIILAECIEEHALDAIRTDSGTLLLLGYERSWVLI
jgi:hypothetical protein